MWLSTRLFVEDNTALIQQMNADMATNLATQVRGLLEATTDKMRILGTILLNEDIKEESRQKFTKEFFSKDSDFIAVYLEQREPSAKITTKAHALSPELQTAENDAAHFISLLSSDKNFSPQLIFKGSVQITTIRLSDTDTAIAIGIPFIESQEASFSHSLVALVKHTRFTKIFSESDLLTCYLVDPKGRLMAHTDPTRVSAGENVSHLGIVKQMLEGRFNNGQTRYIDPQAQEAKLGAFKLVGFAGLGVIAEVPEAKAFDAARKVEHRSVLVGLIVLSIAFLAGYLYSGTISRPIKRLVAAARRISAGDFNINLKPKGRDEVASLSVAFNEMAKGLEERDRVKEAFNKFHNKEIAEKLLSGEIKLGGERKEATIFFSDVRGFTALSESLQPEQVVEMLNEYFTRMVAIIRSRGGVVDKYVGDAIMALWGVPLSSHDDTRNALMACLAMRTELVKLNEIRLSRGQPILKIGMGLNIGPVIAGNIGSNEKMEYTVIGDAVNLASRIESMTKDFGVDLLISRDVYERITNDFICEACESAKVKGKSAAVEVYKVRGYISKNRENVMVESPYATYESEKSGKVCKQNAATSDDVFHQFMDPTTLTTNIAHDDNSGAAFLDGLSEASFPLGPIGSDISDTPDVQVVIALPVLEEKTKLTSTITMDSVPKPPPFKKAG